MSGQAFARGDDAAMFPGALRTHRVMPRALSFRLQIVVDAEFLAAVDGWRRKQPDVPNRSEAIRRMVKIVGRDAAEAERAAKKRPPKGG
jgi:hypothetical protein